MALLTGHIVSETNAGAPLSSFFLFSLEPEPMGNVLPTSWVDIPPQLNVLTDTPRGVPPS